MRLFASILLLLMPLPLQASLTNAVVQWGVSTNFWGILGDSIGSGYPNYQTFPDGGPSGDTNRNLAILDFISSTNKMTGTNLAKPSAYWNDVQVTQLPGMLALHPKYIFFHCGINDLEDGTNWTEISINLSNILVSCQANSPPAKMVIGGIFADTNLSNLTEATNRLWNTLYYQWAIANGQYFLDDHNFMGQIRASTGQYDDLKTAYDIGEGIHLSNTGYTNWQSLILQFMVSIEADSPTYRWTAK